MVTEIPMTPTAETSLEDEAEQLAFENWRELPETVRDAARDLGLFLRHGQTFNRRGEVLERFRVLVRFLQLEGDRRHLGDRFRAEARRIAVDQVLCEPPVPPRDGSETPR